MDPNRGFSLAAVVLLALVLPLAASAWRAEAAGRKSQSRTVWAGQLLGALAGLWIVGAPMHPEFGVAAAVVTCLIGLLALRRQMRPVRPSRA